MADTMRDRDGAQNEIDNMKVQLHRTEDKADDLGNQLNDTIRKLKECKRMKHVTNPLIIDCKC